MPNAALRPIFIAIILFSFLFLSSCVSTQRAIYFNNIQNRDFAEEDVVSVMQKSDPLSITVSSLNPEATIIFNIPNQPLISSSSGIGNGSIRVENGKKITRRVNFNLPDFLTSSYYLFNKQLYGYH